MNDKEVPIAYFDIQTVITSQKGERVDLTGKRACIDVSPDAEDRRTGEPVTLLWLTEEGDDDNPQYLGAYRDEDVGQIINILGDALIAQEATFEMPGRRSENKIGQLRYLIAPEATTRIVTQKGKTVRLSDYEEPLILHDVSILPANTKKAVEEGKVEPWTVSPEAVAICIYTAEVVNSKGRLQPIELGRYKPDRAYIVGSALSESIEKGDGVFVMPKKRS